jgi:hypothetical protein
MVQGGGSLLACGEVQHQQLGIIQVVVERGVRVIDMQRGQRPIAQEDGYDFTFVGTWNAQALLLQVLGSRIRGGTQIKAISMLPSLSGALNVLSPSKQPAYRR